MGERDSIGIDHFEPVVCLKVMERVVEKMKQASWPVNVAEGLSAAYVFKGPANEMSIILWAVADDLEAQIAKAEDAQNPRDLSEKELEVIALAEEDDEDLITYLVEAVSLVDEMLLEIVRPLFGDEEEFTYSIVGGNVYSAPADEEDEGEEVQG